MRRPHFSLLLLLLATLACGSPATPVATPQPQSQTATISPGSPQQAPITIAIEYGIFGVADAYTPTGVTYAKPQLVFGIWGNLEPERGQWQWEPLDALIAEYQAAGFSGQQILLTAESPWASSVPAGLLTQLDSFPKDEYIADYENFVRSVVERYDGDGVDDMPGLIYPIHEYGIEREFTGYWPGSADDYVRLLRIAYPVIHEADPEAIVMQAALLLIDIFDGGTTDTAEIERRWRVSRINRSLEENLLVIAACDAYDVLDFHSLGDYIEIPSTTAWIREQLRAYDCGDVPIWIGDAFSMSGLVGYGAVPAHPTTAATRDQVIALLRAVADSSDADHEIATAWLRAEMAIGLVRKIVVSAGEGIMGINIGNLEDWALGTAADEALVPMMGSSMFMGMTDTTVIQDRPGGPLPYSGHMWSQARTPGQERPAFYALQLVMETVSEYTSIEKLDLGDHVWGYRCETSNGAVWVLWFDDGELYLPGQARPGVNVNLEIEADQAVLTLTPTVVGEPEPESFIIDAVDGEISFELGLTPVFIQITP